jgi:predicted transcriptional regulator
MNAAMLIRPDEETRKRLARLARLTYGKSSERIESELAGRLLEDALTDRLELAERIAAARSVNSVKAAA